MSIHTLCNFLFSSPILFSCTLSPLALSSIPVLQPNPVLLFPVPPRRGQWHLHGHDNIQLYAEIVKERRYETESERDEALDAVAGESRRLVEIVLDKALFGVLDQPGEESDHA